MGFRLFNEDTPWEQARKDVRTTAAAVAAEKDHAALAKPLRALLTQWGTVEQERRDADDAMVDANALVRHFDKKLDRAVEKLVSRLEFEVGGERSKPGFAEYFPEPPNEVIRLGLESEIARTERFDNVAKELGASKQVRALLATIDGIRKEGAKVLETREEVAKRQGRVSLRISVWKESANAARRGVENALDAYAIANDLPRDYSDEFFPPARVSKKTKTAKAPAKTEPA
jgi:hypothetical protein